MHGIKQELLLALDLQVNFHCKAC